MFSVCLSVHTWGGTYLPGGGGYLLSGLDGGGGYLLRSGWRGVPTFQGLDRGGTYSQVWMGEGVPTQVWMGGTYLGGGTYLD